MSFARFCGNAWTFLNPSAKPGGSQRAEHPAHPRGKGRATTSDCPQKHHYVDRAGRKAEEGTESPNPQQIAPARSVSTPVCTVVNVGSWQRPELRSLLSRRSEGRVRTEGSAHQCCESRLVPHVAAQSLRRPLAPAPSRGTPPPCNTVSSRPVLKHGHGLENRCYTIEPVSVVSPYLGPRSAAWPPSPERAGHKEDPRRGRNIFSPLRAPKEGY